MKRLGFAFLMSAALFSPLVFVAGCLQKKTELVEKTPPSYGNDEVVVKMEVVERKAKKEQKDKTEERVAMNLDGTDTNTGVKGKQNENPNLLMDEEGMPLDLSFAEISGRANPFIPPGSALGVPTSVPTSTPTPSFVNSSSAVPILAKDPMKGQLMPIAGQEKAAEPAVPPIPEWTGESPILSAGPPERLQSMLPLIYTGLMTNTKGKKVGALQFVVVDEVAGKPKILSYIVKPGKYVTEYNLKVVDLDSHHIVLTRGNQRIELPLVETSKTLTRAVSYPTSVQPMQSPYASKPGSASQWSPSIGGGASGSAQ